MDFGYRLLAPDEPGAVSEERRHGRSRFVILVDHASNRIPRRLGNLGLPAQELERHIAWDIGALAVARHVAAALDAPLIAQSYSRLVIDCNREPSRAASIPTVSELTQIEGNRNLSDEERRARRTEIFEPYHAHIAALLTERAAANVATILIAQHTMTDVFKGVRRSMHAAVLYNRDGRFAHLVLEGLRRETGLIIAENEPYALTDETDYSIPHHAEQHGWPYAEIELRQDLVRGPAEQAKWGQRLAHVLREAERAALLAGLFAPLAS
jgi:predicted N-formylglutamate amidohydrolase